MKVFSKYRVVVEFKRVQLYLFNVPKLRTILGANALIGEMLRLKLPSFGERRAKEVFPEVAIALVDDDPVSKLQLEPDSESKSNVDFLWQRDNPKKNYEYGLLARDGGHLQIVFDDLKDAQKFEKLVKEKIETELPGLMYDVKVEKWQLSSSDSPKVLVKTLHAAWMSCADGKAPSVQSIDFPVVDRRICELSGQGWATVKIEPDTRHERPDTRHERTVSTRVKAQWDAGTNFRDRKTKDIVGLLQKYSLLPCFGSGWKSPDDLEKLAGGPGRYLALIHLDGNGVGKRRPNSSESLRDGDTPEDAYQRWLVSEAEVESFFYSMRANVRAALVKSLAEIFKGCVPKDFAGIAPYQLLMVGGDDVLLLMQANYAVEWLIRYAEELVNEARNLSDGKPLDIGAGIVIAKPTFPFHSLHELAEQLASSAKRLSRGKGNQGRSVVDWLVLSESATLAIDEHRRLHDIVCCDAGTEGAPKKEVLITNARPYFVLPAEENSEAQSNQVSKHYTLKDLWDAALVLKKNEDNAARSQRKNLPNALRQGRLAGEAAIRDLPDPLREHITDFTAGDSPWKCVNSTQTEAGAPCTYLTHLVDMLELCEISELGARRSSDQDGSGGNDGKKK